MARKLRIQFPGATYLITSRGDRRQPIFQSDADRQSFLDTFAGACVKTGWQIHALCLMPDHFHLVVETPEPNLVTGMKWFLGTYTARFNRQHKLTGHVFAGRYKSLLIGSGAGFLRTACDYVHLNPARANLVAPTDPLQQYPWSSYPHFLQEPTQRPSWLRVDRLLGQCGVPQDTKDGRHEFEKLTELRRVQDLSDDYHPVRRGWCLGDGEFRRDMLTEVSRTAGSNHFGSELTEAAEARAAQIIDEELHSALWTEAELIRRKKGDPRKIAIATRLRAETTVTLQWIAMRLHMGTKTHLSHLLYWERRSRRTDFGSEESRKEKTQTQVTRTQAVAIQSNRPSSPASNIESIPLPDPFKFDPTFD